MADQQQKPQETITTIERWPNGRIRDSNQEVNGKRHGRLQGWHESGQPSYDWNYEHGEEHGRQQGWYENGRLSYDYNYEHDRQHGRQRGWYENGQPKFDWNYDKHGKWHGRLQRWNENGRQELDASYEHGKLHGNIREWDAAGNLLRDDWYNHGAECTREYYMEESKRAIEAPAASNN